MNTTAAAKAKKVGEMWASAGRLYAYTPRGGSVDCGEGGEATVQAAADWRFGAGCSLRPTGAGRWEVRR